MPATDHPDSQDVEFELKEHAEYVEFACTGTYSPGLQLRIAEQALAAAARAGLDAALIDIRKITGPPPSMSERYDQAIRIADLQATFTPRVRIAVLGKEPMVHPQRFGEIVATNRGALLRVFTERKPALDWLLQRRYKR
ncbi:MAG: hypothetical protein ACT4UP_01795 [Gammaproteobacteria bacterium]